MNRKFTFAILGVLAITTLLIIVLPASDKIASHAIDPYYSETDSDCVETSTIYFYKDGEIGGCGCLNKDAIKTLKSTGEQTDCLDYYCKSVNNTCLTLPSYPEFTACGCGCCGGATPIEKCLYRSKGDDIEYYKITDALHRLNVDCSIAGCNVPIRYKYCD